ncbi:histidine kinase [Flavobacterium longum]|uniref:hybrid sensor histidine kinase/response regulator n=1 Tax=Flavobacterium longum TaxID=1299340 RepID=UPI0039EAEDC5
MILIVDDQRENILPLKKILALHGLESEEALSGEEALRKTLQKHYSLIILDVQMPGMDGFEVAETLAGSSRTKDIPIIFLSAINKEKKYITKGYESGGVDYITKPADPDLFILKVKTFLKLYQQQNELKDIRDLLAREIEIRKDAQENLEQKVIERTRELREKNEELELSNHELQQFAWVVSHDLKEPVRKIEIFVKLMEERCLNGDPNGPVYAKRTIAAAERMNNLINDLLTYSRLSSPIESEPCDLNEILGEVIADLEHLVEEKNAVIRFHDNLPTVIGVPSQLRQVFQNLISNSLKFVPAGRAPEIDIITDRIASLDFDAAPNPDGDVHRIIVKDNGIGFDDQYKDKIFTIFQRLHHREDYEGTGIGLSIARKIIEKHHGLITGESTKGNGASFIILLPATPKNT